MKFCHIQTNQHKPQPVLQATSEPSDSEQAADGSAQALHNNSI